MTKFFSTSQPKQESETRLGQLDQSVYTPTPQDDAVTLCGSMYPADEKAFLSSRVESKKKRSVRKTLGKVLDVLAPEVQTGSKTTSLSKIARCPWIV